MAAKGGVNFVRYFFYAGNTISADRKKALVALAYATARDQQLAPKAILIRSDMHDTTTIDGKHVKDPNGWHGTFAFKDATHILEKADGTPRGGRRSGKVVWPAEETLEEYVDSPVVYSHLLVAN